MVWKTFHWVDDIHLLPIMNNLNISVLMTSIVTERGYYRWTWYQYLWFDLDWLQENLSWKLRWASVFILKRNLFDIDILQTNSTTCAGINTYEHYRRCICLYYVVVSKLSIMPNKINQKNVPYIIFRSRYSTSKVPQNYTKWAR
jgi:hypothetical protein